jgi:hypothetical protein
MESNFTINKEKHINYILDHFDFDKVHNIMTILDWKWYCNDINSGLSVPSIDNIKNTAFELLSDMCKTDINYGDYTETGGFRVTMRNDYLELEFILEECLSSIVNYDEPNYEKIKKSKNRKKKINIIQKLNENEDN